QICANDIDLLEKLRVARCQVEEGSLHGQLEVHVGVDRNPLPQVVCERRWLLVDLRHAVTEERRGVRKGGVVLSVTPRPLPCPDDREWSAKTAYSLRPLLFLFDVSKTEQW